MNLKLYRAGYVGEENDELLAHLTDVEIVRPERTWNGAHRGSQNGTLRCKSDAPLEGRLSAHDAYYTIDEDEEVFNFGVSQIGNPIQKQDGIYEVVITAPR